MAHEVKYDATLDEGFIYYGTGEVDGRQHLKFQHGPVAENGDNGIQNEDVLELLALRLRALNKAFPCRENSIAITHIETANLWLRERTRVRVEQCVEGKNEAHVS